MASERMLDARCRSHAHECDGLLRRCAMVTERRLPRSRWTGSTPSSWWDKQSGSRRATVDALSRRDAGRCCWARPKAARTEREQSVRFGFGAGVQPGHLRGPFEDAVRPAAGRGLGHDGNREPVPWSSRTAREPTADRHEPASAGPAANCVEHRHRRRRWSRTCRSAMSRASSWWSLRVHAPRSRFFAVPRTRRSHHRRRRRLLRHGRPRARGRGGRTRLPSHRGRRIWPSRRHWPCRSRAALEHPAVAAAGVTAVPASNAATRSWPASCARPGTLGGSRRQAGTELVEFFLARVADDKAPGYIGFRVRPPLTPTKRSSVAAGPARPPPLDEGDAWILEA